MSQTTAASYQNDLDLGFPGMLAKTTLKESISLINSESAGVAFGLGVVDKLDGTFEELDAGYKDVRGATLHTYAYDNATDTEQVVPADKTGDVLVKGHIIVTAETAVTDGDDAYCRFADGVADVTQTTKGGWGADDDTNTRRHVKGAKFRSTVAKDALAVLELTDELGGFDLMTQVEQVGALSATTTILMGAAPVGRQMRLQSVQLSAGVTAEDATDHWVIELKAGTTVLATWDSDVAVDGGITQGTPTALNKVADVFAAPGEAITAVFTLYNSGAALTAGEINATFEVL